MNRKKLIILPQVNNCGGDVNKKWFVFFSYRDPADQKMKRFKIYQGLHTLKDPVLRRVEAEKIKKEYEVKLRNGWNPFVDDSREIYEDQLQYAGIAKIYGKLRASNKTVRFFASEYLLYLKKQGRLEENSIATYKSKLRTFLLWLDKHNIGLNDVTVINNDIVLQFFDYLINERQLSGNSVGKYRQIIQAVFDYALRQKAIIQNPVFNVPECNRVNDYTPRPISTFDIEKFKTTIQAEDPQLWLAIQFEYYCFLRPGKELRLLRVKDINFARGIVDVDRFRSKTNLEKYPTIPTVFLNELHEKYKINTYPSEFYVLGKNYQPGPEPWSKNTLRFRFRKFREKLNMPELYKFYSWKHTGNCMATDANISTRALQDQNGHTSIKTTENYIKYKIGKANHEIRDLFPPL